MFDEPFGRPPRQLSLFDGDVTPVPVATPEPAQVELPESVKADIRARFRRGAMQTQLLARYGIDRETLLDTLAGLRDPNAGPSDEQLDMIFGPMRGPGVKPDERGDVGTTRKTADA